MSDQSAPVTDHDASPAPAPGGSGYAATWLVDEDLEALNRRIHDGVPDEALMDRARGYRDGIFNTYPGARPPRTARVLELGSGVGWIMEAVLERFEVEEIVGLDISENMIRRAEERFSDPRARFVLYDGFKIPFDNGYFDTVYSVAAMQHIEKHIAFLLFEELYRVLAPGGHAVIHLLAIDHIPGSTPNYHDECMNHVNNAPVHWHHYYSFDELFVLFSDVIGVDELDLTYIDQSFWVHFSKQTGRRYLRAELPSLRFTPGLRTEAAVASGQGAPGPAAPAGTTAELGRAFMGQLLRDGRARVEKYRNKQRGR